MESLTELIGTEVHALIDDIFVDEWQSTDTVMIRCKVKNVRIQDFYFKHQYESINILLSLEPIEGIEELKKRMQVDAETFIDVPLVDIRKEMIDGNTHY